VLQALVAEEISTETSCLETAKHLPGRY